MGNNKENIQSENNESKVKTQYHVSKSRHLYIQDLLNEWNQTPPATNQSTNSKPKTK